MIRSSNLSHKAASGIFWSFTDLVANQGVQFVIQVILARLLLVEDFGLVAMTTIFISISASIIDSGFSQALIREQAANQEDFSTVFYFNLAVAFGLYIILFLSATSISKFFDEPELTTVLRVLSLVLIINAFGIIQRVLLVRAIDFKTQTKISLTASIISGFIAVAFAFSGFGVWSLVARTLVMQLMIALLLSMSNKWKPSLIFSKKSFKRYFKFGSRLLLSGLINTIYLDLYLIIIGKFFSTTDLGYFTNAKKLRDILSHSVTTSLQRVTYPVLSSIQENENRLRNSFKKMIRTTTFINFPIMVFFSAIAQSLIDLIFGQKWLPSVPFFQIMCFTGLFYPLNAININIFQVKGRTDLVLRLEIIKKCFITITVAIVLLLRLGIFALVWTTILNSFFGFLMNSYYSKKLISYSIKDQIKDILPSLLLSFTMGAIVYITGILMPGGDLIKLLVQTLVGFTTYIGLSKLFKIQELGIIKDLALSFVKKARR